MSANACSQAPFRGFGHLHRFYDEQAHRWTTQVMPGEHYVTQHDEIITTVLGSCVSTCIRDVKLGLGGINHFMLPGASPTLDLTARYGQVALERLINDLVKHGARREHFEIKLFGGGRVMGGSNNIGQSNIDFVLAYLAAEHLSVQAQCLGKSVARRLRYFPMTGQAQVKHLSMSQGLHSEREAQRRRSLQGQTLRPGDVELF
jgi:chemotaxis protein CheD